ncbi:MAG TPA: porin family protein [Gemmatimonadales bacterium]
MTRTKRTLAAAAILLSLAAAPLQGQVLIGYIFSELLTTPTFNVGFELGMNFASLDGLEGAERTSKTVFGIFTDWRFSEHFHLGSGILPIAARGADGMVPVPTGDPAIDGQTANGVMNRNLGMVEIPLVLKWAPKRESGFRIGAGPSLGIITGASDRYEATTAAGTPYVLERDIKDQLPGMDFGLSFDVEWRFPMFSVAARYTHGLTDIGHTGATEAVYSRTLTGTGRIYLGKGKKAAADTTRQE